MLLSLLIRQRMYFYIPENNFDQSLNKSLFTPVIVCLIFEAAKWFTLMVIMNIMLHNICIIIWRWKFRICVVWVCFIVSVYFCVLWDDGVIVLQGYVERKRTTVYRC
jgi:hypothetical protein